MTRLKGDKSTTVKRAADEEIWHVFSEIPKDVRMFTRYYGEGKSVGSFGGMEWEVPVDNLKIHKKRPAPTEAQIAKARENLKKAKETAARG